MKRMSIVMLAAVLFASSFGASKALASEVAHYYFGFDESVKPWTAGSSDGYLDDGTLTLGFDENVARLRPGNGNRYAVLANEHGNVVWMKSTFVADARNVRVEFLAKNVEGCEGCIPIVYVGRNSPQYPGQFKTTFSGLGEVWSYEGIDFTLDSDYLKGEGIGNTMVVAVGFTMLEGDAYCPDQRRIAIDNLHITVSNGVDN